jgi:hypothetical protein
MVRHTAQSFQSDAPRPQRVTKKQQIIALYLAGMTEVEDLAAMADVQPSYVGAVLQQAGLIRGYFDLYTSTAHPMNAYAKCFANRLGFKDEAAARRSVAVLEQRYQQFALTRDRAGQHHALSMALVMFDRARWMGKMPEAAIFRQWLMAHLEQTDAAEEAPTPGRGEPVPVTESARQAEALPAASGEGVSELLMPC